MPRTRTGTLVQRTRNGVPTWCAQVWVGTGDERRREFYSLETSDKSVARTKLAALVRRLDAHATAECARDGGEPPASPGVYFVQTESGPIKIGMASKSIRSRLAALQTASPSPLRFLGYLEGDRETERGLHCRFAPFRKTGEWFEPAAVLVRFIEGETLPGEA